MDSVLLDRVVPARAPVTPARRPDFVPEPVTKLVETEELGLCRMKGKVFFTRGSHTRVVPMSLPRVRWMEREHG